MKTAMIFRFTATLIKFRSYWRALLPVKSLEHLNTGLGWTKLLLKQESESRHSGDLRRFVVSRTFLTAQTASARKVAIELKRSRARGLPPQLRSILFRRVFCGSA